MSDTALWREALTTEDHPLYQPAWIMFNPRFSPDTAHEKLESQQKDVLPLLYSILEDEKLYTEDGAGGGDVPKNCVELITRWKPGDAAPYLLKILTNEAYVEDAIIDRAAEALGEFGSTILGDVLNAAEIAPEETHEYIAELLARVGKGDDRAYDWILEQIDEQEDKWSIEEFAASLLDLDFEKARAELESRIEAGQYDEELASRLKDSIQYRLDELAAEEEDDDDDDSEVTSDTEESGDTNSNEDTGE